MNYRWLSLKTALMFLKRMLDKASFERATS